MVYASGLIAPNERRVFLDVKDVAELLLQLQSANGFFVPCRLNFSLGFPFVLVLRVTGCARPIELAVGVVGRRLPRVGSLLSAGVFVRALDADDAVLVLLADVVRGSVVDLEARVQESQRVRCVWRFASVDEAHAELRALLVGPSAVPLDVPAQRDDKLRVALEIADQSAATIDVVVRSVHTYSHERLVTVALVSEAERQRVAGMVEGMTLRRRIS